MFVPGNYHISLGELPYFGKKNTNFLEGCHTPEYKKDRTDVERLKQNQEARLGCLEPTRERAK